MKYTKQEEHDMIKYFRFRNYKPSKTQKTYMTYKSIAKFLNRSTSFVQNKCKQIIVEDKADKELPSKPFHKHFTEQ